MSETELNALSDYYCGGDREKEKQFAKLIDIFFEQDSTLEQLLEATCYSRAALKVAENAAASDGLDPRENIALRKCENLMQQHMSDLETPDAT